MSGALGDVLPALLAGALAGLAVAMPIGPIGTYLLGLAARERFALAAAAALGVATTDGAYALLAGLGAGAVERVLAAVAGPLRVVAALVLVTLAVRLLLPHLRRPGAALSTPRKVGADDIDTPTETVVPAHFPPGGVSSDRGARQVAGSGAGPVLTTYALLVGLTAVNPTTLATFAAIVVGHAAAFAPGVLTLGAFALGAFSASAAWQLTLVGAGTALGRVLSGPRGQRVVAVASAAVMLALALVALIG